MDLFDQLADRHEMFTQLGRDGVTLQTASWFYYVLSGLVAVMMLVKGCSLAQYYVVFLVLTAFLLLALLISETSNSLVNPVEGLVLAHQPIDGATYTAAKLSHLLRILLYLVPGLNVIPALAALTLAECRWFYPLVHMVAAFAVGLLAALLCCAIFGWLIRFVPPRRLKAVGQIAEMMPSLAYMASLMPREARTWIHIPHWWPAAGPARLFLVVGLCATAAAIVLLGIRALSGDYLVRVAAIAQAGSGKKAKVRGPGGAPRLSDAVARLCGGPASRAGYEYVWSLMMRDWQFRRLMIPLIPLAVAPVALLVEGWRISPFSGKFTGVHVLPHVFGVALFLICTVLPYGSDFKGAWIFLLAPRGTLEGFARGVHARLWLAIVAIPHAALAVTLSVAWGIWDGAMFTAYSLAIASCYLGLELRLIDGMPFSKPPRTSQNAYLVPLMFAGGFGIAIVVGLQYFLLFRSVAAVAATTVVAAAGACLLTRRSLESC
jgi:hypothetical protein